jgi:hypothetical protein
VGLGVSVGVRFVLPTILSAENPAPEYQVKAVFLFNFALFVEWPRESFPDTHSPMIIGILGKDPFGTFLDETIRGETVNNRPLIVRRYQRVEDIQACHVLFISRSESVELRHIVESLKGRSILTVGDFEGFATRGGAIRFVTEKSKTRLKINLEATKSAKLTISSKLLKSAEIVSSGKY